MAGLSWGLHGELVRVANKLRVINKNSFDYGTGESINTFDIHIIDAIGRGYGRNVTDLADWFYVTKGAISQVVSRLNQGGYINKDRNPVYCREVVLSLTAKGEIALSGYEKVSRKIYEGFLTELETIDEEKLLEMKELLVQINRQLEKSVTAVKNSFS